MKQLPTKKQIVFTSMQSNNLSLDFRLLKEEIEYKEPSIKLVFLCKKMESSLNKKLDYIKYVFNMVGYMFKAMYYLSTSLVCVTESYCVPVSILKHKKELKIVQIWHSSGAVKKFGYQCLDTKEGKSRELAELMCMHKNYDYAIAPSSKTKKMFSEAFNMDEKKILDLGLPRLEYITNKKYDRTKEVYDEYPVLKDKKVILYVPTFRKGKTVDLSEILNYQLDKDKYELIIKLHPLEKNRVPDEYNISSKYTIYDLIKIADYIITDYSILSIEASILEKPIFLYLYDIEEYSKNRGLNIDLSKELESFTSKTFNDIMDKIEKNNYDIQEIINYKNNYIQVDATTCIRKLADFITDLV